MHTESAAAAMLRETAQRRRRYEPRTVEQQQQPPMVAAVAAVVFQPPVPTPIPTDDSDMPSPTVDDDDRKKPAVPSSSISANQSAIQEEWKCASDVWSQQLAISAKKKSAAVSKQQSAAAARNDREHQRQVAADEAKTAALERRLSSFDLTGSSNPADRFANVILRSIFGSGFDDSPAFLRQPIPTRTVFARSAGGTNNPMAGFSGWMVGGPNTGGNNGFGFDLGRELMRPPAGSNNRGIGTVDSLAQLLDMSLRHPQPNANRGSSGSSLVATAPPPPAVSTPVRSTNPTVRSTPPTAAEATKCPVCLETSDESPGADWRIFPCCRNYAHTNCARESLRRDSRCPFCRHIVT